MKSTEANLRLIEIPSQKLGQDWMERIGELDEMIPQWGMELASEEVWISFDGAPGSVLNGEGTSRIGRSVIGPKKDLSPPFQLTDIVSLRVYRKELKGSSWSSILEEAFDHWQTFHRDGVKIDNSFYIRLTRRMSPGLVLAMEVVFKE